MNRVVRSCIRYLDASLAEVGENIVLQRFSTDDEGAQYVTNSAECRASVRAHQPQEFGMVAGEGRSTTIVLSPSDLTAAMWPGLPGKDDRVLIQGRPANVEIVSPFYVFDALVRIELECRE